MEENKGSLELSDILIDVADFGIEQDKVSKIEKVDSFNTLTERPPMLTIGKDVWEVDYEDSDEEKKSLFIGTLFNPGHVPKAATIGLAVSQVLATATLNQNGELLHKKKRTPMVTNIKSIRFTENADIKTPSKEPFYIVIPENIPGQMQTQSAELYYQKIKMCDIALEMQALSPGVLEKRGLRKRMNWGGEKEEKQNQVIQNISQNWTEPKGKIYVPGFGDDYALEQHAIKSDTERVGVMRVNENIFEGHFPDAKIIPLAGTALPGFMLALDWFNETHQGELFEISTIEDVEVGDAVLPNDVLYYELKQKTENSFELEVFFIDKDEQLQKAIRFGNLEISPAKRLENLWGDEAISDAFAFQNMIPEYQTEQLDVFREQVGKACKSFDYQGDTLKIADIGAGVAANISKIALEELGKYWDKDIQLSITDVDIAIAKQAEANLRDQGILKDNVSVQHFASSQNGEVIPDIGEQDMLVANFSMNYGNIDQTIQKLSDSVRIGGQIIIGLVNPHPKYYKLLNMVAQRMNEAQDWSFYDEYLRMKEAGNAMDYFDILGHKQNCDYIDSASFAEKLEKSGFDIDEIVEDTFAGIGHIIRATKK